MPAKTTKKSSFKEVLIEKIDEYMDQAFATTEEEKRNKYREAIRQMQQLMLTVSEIE